MSKRTLLIAFFAVALTAFSMGVIVASVTHQFNLLVCLVTLNLAATASLTLIFQRQIKHLLHTQRKQVNAKNRSDIKLLEHLAESERRHMGSFETERLRAEDRHYELLSSKHLQTD